MTSITYTGKCCPHCATKQVDLIKLIFTPGCYTCPTCGATVHVDKLRLIEECITPAHWSKRFPLVNPDKMQYDGKVPNPGCVFDHRKQRPYNPNSGRAEIRQPLKVYKRG